MVAKRMRQAAIYKKKKPSEKRPLGDPIPDEATFIAIKWKVEKGILWTTRRTVTRGHNGGF
ncbi:hypothetical protein SESBI_26540 [Sesbania bispinosa]|nr:hypothetical protein SESBI_26540 [Sesbania bispinosa]